MYNTQPTTLNHDADARDWVFECVSWLSAVYARGWKTLNQIRFSPVVECFGSVLRVSGAGFMVEGVQGYRPKHEILNPDRQTLNPNRQIPHSERYSPT